MAIKVYMGAYDRVDWGILSRILELLGFDEKFVSLIMCCISTAPFSFLINGSPFGLVTAGRGIRQGVSSSPALFTILFDLLSRILYKTEVERKIHGVKIARTSPTISHLMYTDDLIIYCRATTQETMNIKACLDDFCNISG